MRLAGEGSAADASSTSERCSETYPRSERLRRRPDFLRVQRDGARVHTPHYVVVVLPRTEGDGVRRLGITVTKKVANAVGRNRVKRVVREVYRKNRDLFPEGCDIVVMAKSGAPELGYHEAVAELAKVSGPLARAARVRRRSAPRDETRGQG
jgi:ribonuclease P protein component